MAEHVSGQPGLVADNGQHGSLISGCHHVGTDAVHLEFNCPQSAKSDSLQLLVPV